MVLLQTRVAVDLVRGKILGAIQGEQITAVVEDQRFQGKRTSFA